MTWHRALLTICLCTLAASAFAPLARSQAPTESPAKFEFKEINDKSLGLWEQGKPVLVYNHGEMTLPNVRRARPRSSYVHPLYGLEGEVLTDDFPRDHYHHHGLFWSWPHVTIGDREYDLWIPRGIRIDFERWKEKTVDEQAARLGVENGWYVGDKKVMAEELQLVVHPATDDSRLIDVTLTWTPTDEPITLRGAEEKSYGGLTLRFAPRTGTVITVPDGRTSEDLVVTKLPWADLSAQFRGASGSSGAAVFVHPSHPDYPPEWMTRDYGVLAVGWPGVEEKTLPAGEPVTCRYRVWVHRGVPDVRTIQGQYEAYRATSAKER